MKMTKTSLLVAAALALFAAPVLAGDLIQLKTGKWMPTAPAAGEQEEPSVEDLEASQYTVVEENYDVTFYKIEGVGQRQKYDTAKIRRVVYGEKPAAFLEASDAMGSGHFGDAVAGFDALAKQKRNPHWVRQYSLYNIGRIYQEGAGDFQNAIAAWERYERDFPKGKFLPKVLVSKGLAWLALGDEAKARSSFGKIERLKGLPEGAKMKGKYWMIKITQLKGEKSGNTALINQALSQYKALLEQVESKSELQEVAILARLGIGDCLLLLEKYGEALDFFKKIAASSDEPDVLAGAYNGLGRCHYAKEEWGEALLCFLRTVILYDTNQEQTAMALYYAAKSYTMRQGDDWKNRARSLFRECINRYPSTQWKRLSEEGILTVR
ncbi:MAG: tetratricopeptide repeat protein [Planctomycetota bacterium]